MSKNTTDKMIPDPENPEEMIENPDYVKPEESEELTDAEKAKLQKLVDAALAPIKDKLDKAYGVRDEALVKLKEIEQKERDAEIAKLKEDGKLSEAYEAEKADLLAQLKAQEDRITSLSRDTEVRDAVSSIKFRNDKSRKVAIREINDELVRDEKGVWKHKSGVSIESFVQTFFKDDENAYLLKPATNSGGGTDKSDPPKITKKAKSIFDKTQDEVLQDIIEKREKARSGK